MSDEQAQPIIVKKVIKKGGGHHGGAWKVAYADFVTAMMAFFLLLWLLNVATDEARHLISSFFDPSLPKVSRRDSGSGGVLGGLSISSEGSMTDSLQPLNSMAPTGKKGKGESQKKSASQLTYDKPQHSNLNETHKKREQQRLKGAEAALKRAVAQSEALKDMSDQLKISLTEEGLKIEITDQDGKPIFPSGSAVMPPQTTELVLQIAEIIKDTPNKISLRGHTDSVPFGEDNGYTNWELSTDRANATRRVITQTFVEESRIVEVIGKASREPYVKNDPEDPQNRRITILLERESLEEALARGGLNDIAILDDNGEIEYIEETVPLEPIAPVEIDKGYEKTQGEFFFP
jgi:chemotaxis protein MotB